jgi:DNA-3-methyladenine glycosylase
MKKRRGMDRVHDLANGPGKLCLAMGIDRTLNGADFLGDALYMIDDGFTEFTIQRSPRIGIRVGADRHWRFFIKGSEFISKSKFNKTRNNPN